MLEELATPDALSGFLSSHPHSLVCFSATWCGPCKKTKPQLEALAAAYAADPHVNVSCGIVYEHVLKEEIQTYKIRAFPTYVLFKGGNNELDRVQGADFDAIKSLVGQHCKSHDFGGTGNSLGGGASAALSAADARAQRLARFGGGGNGNTPNDTAATDAGIVAEKEEEVADEEMNDAPKAEASAPTKTEEVAKMDVDEPEQSDAACAEEEMIDPTENLKKEDVETLTESMGFSLIRAQKGLLNGNGTVEGAVEWLLTHQEDVDIDDPIEKVASTKQKKPLTAEEKEAKLAKVKALLKSKRSEREKMEKVENVDREKQRRFMGQEMIKTKEQMEIEARKRMARQRKKEKEDAVRERQRIRAELEKDKRERAANKGKLSSKLGVDGYNPDAIQYDVPGEGGAAVEDKDEEAVAKKPKKAAPSAAKMDEYISKISSYRAGGDGGNCLKILKAYIGNVVKNPDDPKYRKINMENKAYRMKVKPLMGAKNLLLCVGFAVNEEGTALELAEDADADVLKRAKEKVEAAYEKYMK
mmetsp:Transcript_16057/g.24345  ORF Transcript_16057/g.24345 Transcript_16057/m.24345 type:complete len:529 (+) Transcript_16057:48-1634(+)|eukprot:CAMPEP_0196140542 /NCGR_PEP_ID=MMETSP0910-20130528/7409_1 /TAXON_ID=49265 /ORGANISM="Thalassiosira rotula, Strain GSO102" /LENGTH=528 /DNA_ID=CAMNT_0041401415 /DNA_START=78 /DNA_END=1664 /DNA_ORIENTATION=+